MKRSAKNKKLSSLAKRNNARQKRKAAYVDELKRLLELTNVSYEGAKFADVYERADSSRRKIRRELVTEGVFRGSRSGYGFVERESGRDIFIPEDKTGGALDGDVVEIVYHSFYSNLGEEKTEGRVTKIKEENRKTVIGTLRKTRTGHGRRSMFVYILEPDSSKITKSIDVVDTMSALDGDKVEAKLLRHGRYLECAVIRVFGESESFGANYSSVLAECGIEEEFSPEAEKIAEEAAAEPISAVGRRDLRDEIIFTIDGAGAKDLDDAISLKRLPGGYYRLGVHIADVSYYVGEKNALDRAAMSRGTSVYFTDKVVPMLPPVLSNGACSLNAGEDKYAISVFIKLDADGEIVSSEIFPSVIKSSVRGVYSEVNAIFGGVADKEIKDKYRRVIPTLMRMRELYERLLSKSQKKGALELEGNEAQIVLDADGHPTDIIKRERGVGERLIEQFMLAANEAVAIKLHTLGLPCVYRVHEPPPPEKLESLITYLSNLAFDTRGVRVGDSVSLTALGKILSLATERGISTPVSYAILRAMSKAKYSENPSAHFGLSIPLYCHFTSPIRRLSDLATHRIIRRTLFEGKRGVSYLSYAKRAAAAASDAELRAMNAERRIEDMYRALYLSDKIGEVFDAKVSSVTSFGMFCELDNTCEGLVPISDMDGMFVFDEKNLSLASRDKVYRLGDEVRVRVLECDVNNGKVRFSLK